MSFGRLLFAGWHIYMCPEGHVMPSACVISREAQKFQLQSSEHDQTVLPFSITPLPTCFACPGSPHCGYCRRLKVSGSPIIFLCLTMKLILKLFVMVEALIPLCIQYKGIWQNAFLVCKCTRLYMYMYLYPQIPQHMLSTHANFYDQ